MHGIREHPMIVNFYKQFANFVIVNNLTIKFKVECIDINIGIYHDIGNSIGLPYTVSCLVTSITYFTFIFAASLITSRKTSMITTRGTSRIKDLALVVRKRVARPTRKVAQMTSPSTTKMEVDEKVVKRWAAKISV